MNTFSSSSHSAETSSSDCSWCGRRLIFLDSPSVCLRCFDLMKSAGMKNEEIFSSDEPDPDPPK
jgi:hypothetical protein